MASIKIKVQNRNGHTMIASASGENVYAVYTAAYEEGDRIVIEASEPGLHCEVRLEDTMLPALVYLKELRAAYPIPGADRRPGYSPKSFSGTRHLITARLLPADELTERRNLALNPYDYPGNDTLYPHASANCETRGDAVFSARNAIDGILANASHGEYPYQSWDVNQREDAELRLDFGRLVQVDEIRMILRADFPHDNYWTEATFVFSDGSVETAALIKTPFAQSGKFEPKMVDWVIIKNLLKSTEASPFPALTQFEAWGTVYR